MWVICGSHLDCSVGQVGQQVCPTFNPGTHLCCMYMITVYYNSWKRCQAVWLCVSYIFYTYACENCMHFINVDKQLRSYVLGQ